MTTRKLGIRDIRLVPVNWPNRNYEISLKTCADRLNMIHGPGISEYVDDNINKDNVDNIQKIVEAETQQALLSSRRLLGYVLRFNNRDLIYFSTGQELPDCILNSDAKVIYRVERVDIDWLGNPK